MLISQLLRLPAITATLAAGQAISSCSNAPTRKEWRQLIPEERESYVDAVHCLAMEPSRLGLNTTLYDDFSYVHNLIKDNVHFVASFLPWHRYFVHVYEQALQECGYLGTATYWDWTLDSPDPVHATIWDPNTGLGGNGDPAAAETTGSNNQRIINCLNDGPFKDLRPAYMGAKYSPHCLYRSFTDGVSQPGDMYKDRYSTEKVWEVQDVGDYLNFRIRLENGPHGAIHSAVGGDMIPATSPNDPLFFLHHTQIDRLWWQWQQQDPLKRNVEYSGNKNQNNDSPQVSLDDTLAMLGLAANVKARDVMTTENDLLCYKY